MLCFSNKRKASELQKDKAKKLCSGEQPEHAVPDGSGQEKRGTEATPQTSQASDGKPTQPDVRLSGDEPTPAQAPPVQAEPVRDPQGRPLSSTSGSVWPHAPMTPGSHPPACAQTVVVPPLSRTGRQKAGSLAQEELDRSILNQRLGQLEREAKRLRRKLGLSTSAAEEVTQAAGAGGQPEGQPPPSAGQGETPNGAAVENKSVSSGESVCATLDVQSSVPTVDLTTTGQMLMELTAEKQTQAAKVKYEEDSRLLLKHANLTTSVYDVIVAIHRHLTLQHHCKMSLSQFIGIYL